MTTSAISPGGASPSCTTWRPGRWLGAPAPGGLALPAARPTASQLYAPRGVWLDDEQLVVCDSGNHRVLIWHGVPIDDHAPAAVVLGQSSFTAEGPAAAGRGPANGLHLPTGVIVAEGRLLVADAWHHRILVWNEVPRESDTPPDWCLGQPSLQAVDRNRGGRVAADALYWPYGLAWIGGRLHVADTGNRRVLIWGVLPDHDRPADVVLGQPDIRSAAENRGGPAGPDSFRWPHAIAGTVERLFVADAGDHRVLSWAGQPDADGPADCVLGQCDFTTTTELPHRPQGPTRLRFPYGISQADDLLAVADTANNRVLLWPLPIEEAAGPPAASGLGQDDFDTSGENRWRAVTADSLCWPYGICLHRSAGDGMLHLAVADSGNNRVTIWISEGA
ncbi:MAG: NHL repeat-containing protein [Pirellulales bacterium]